MAQAKRIRRKPVTKAKPSKRKSDKSWGLMLIILVSGIVIGMLLTGVSMGGMSFGEGLRQLFGQAQSEEDKRSEIAELIKNKSSSIEYDFYEILPDMDQVLPTDSAPKPGREVVAKDYYLQAASFRDQKDADALRAQLALKGFVSTAQARQVEGKGMFYRVRLGPYANKRVAKNAKTSLQKLGVQPFIYAVEK